MPTQDKIQEAISNFGQQAVTTAISVVNLSDPDGAYTLLEDMGEFAAAEAVEFLYFEG